MPGRPDIVAYQPDIYSPQAILDPYPHYATLRELGPVVWLPKHKVYALPRSAECKTVLLDDTTFISGDGVALNPVTNRLSRGTTLNCDGEQRALRRALVANRLTPRALRTMTDLVERQAAEIVEAALDQRWSGTTPTPSTAAATPPGNWASAAARTAAPTRLPASSTSTTTRKSSTCSKETWCPPSTSQRYWPPSTHAPSPHCGRSRNATAIQHRLTSADNLGNTVSIIVSAPSCHEAQGKVRDAAAAGH